MTTTSTVSLAIDGMTNRSCADRVERALSGVPAVLSVAVEFESELARIELSDMQTEAVAIAAVEALMAAATGAGYTAHLRGYEGPPVSKAKPAAAKAAERPAEPLAEADDGLAASRHETAGRPRSSLNGSAPAHLRVVGEDDEVTARQAEADQRSVDATDALESGETGEAVDAVDARATARQSAANDDGSNDAAEADDVRRGWARRARAFAESRRGAGRETGGESARETAHDSGRELNRETARESRREPAGPTRLTASGPAEAGSASASAQSFHDPASGRLSARRQRPEGEAPPPLASRVEPDFGPLEAPAAPVRTSGEPGGRDRFAHDEPASATSAGFDPAHSQRDDSAEPAAAGASHQFDDPAAASDDGPHPGRGPARDEPASFTEAANSRAAGYFPELAAGHPAGPDRDGLQPIAATMAPFSSDAPDAPDAPGRSAAGEPASRALAGTEADEGQDVPGDDHRALPRGPDGPGLPSRSRPALVEPGRLALSGRHVLAICAALTAILLIPSLATLFGLPLALPSALQFALATAVLLLGGIGIARGALDALGEGRVSVDSLAVLGSVTAWGLSIWLWRDGAGAHRLYFETAAGLTTLALAGRFLVYRTRRTALQTIDAVATAQPGVASRIVDVEDAAIDGEARPIQEQRIPVTALAQGDIIMVRSGETFPADGLVVDGETQTDESLLTGDPTPVLRAPGDPVFAGTVNGSGRVFARIERVGNETTLARMLNRLEEAQGSRTLLERKVDGIMGWLVPAVVIIAGLTLGFWLWRGLGGETALARALAVLAVGFPCALALAAPASLIAGTRAAARAGILVRDARVIEAMPAIRTVAFEQTGSLTEGRPGVRQILPAPGVDRESLLAMAAAIEAGSDHPLAEAVSRFASSYQGFDEAPGEDGEAPVRRPPPRVEAVGVRALPGAGIAGRVRFPGSADADEAVPVFIGSEALMLEQGLDLSVLGDELELAHSEGWTISLVAMARPDSDPMLLGAILFADTPRPGARNAVEALRKAGIAPVMLSGDTAGTARSTGATLGIDETVGELEARGVAGWVQRAREAGRGVAMVGDAVDDAAPLDSADLGIAMSNDLLDRDIAIDSAAVTLMRDDVRLVPAALDIGRRTSANLRQNLAWALIFSAIGIPLAAAGYLSPVLAVVVLAASMICVVVNGLRLDHWKPDPDIAPF